MFQRFRFLYQYNRWANRSVLAALQDTPGCSARTIEVFAHVVAAEAVWLARILGEDSTQFRSGRLGRYQNRRGEWFETPLIDGLLHLWQHGGYHRVQLAAWIRAEVGIPPNPDDITFVRQEMGQACSSG